MKKIVTIFAILIAVTTTSTAYGYGGGVGVGSTGGSSGTRVNKLNTPNTQPLTSAQITNLRAEVERLQKLLASLQQGRVLGESTSNFTNDLSEGMENDDVKRLQSKLRELGFFNFPTDTGYFGPVTKSAVIAYQTSKGLPATGFVGPLTRAELNK